MGLVIIHIYIVRKLYTILSMDSDNIIIGYTIV